MDEGGGIVLKRKKSNKYSGFPTADINFCNYAVPDYMDSNYITKNRCTDVCNPTGFAA